MTGHVRTSATIIAPWAAAVQAALAACNADSGLELLHRLESGEEPIPADGPAVHGRMHEIAIAMDRERRAFLLRQPRFAWAASGPEVPLSWGRSMLLLERAGPLGYVTVIRGAPDDSTDYRLSVALIALARLAPGTLRLDYGPAMELVGPLGSPA